MIVYLATAHGSNISGKCSPEKTVGGQFKEWKWSRKICFMLKYLLLEYYKYNKDFDCIIDIIEEYETLPNESQKSGVNKRINMNVNEQKQNKPTKDKNFGCIMVTIHVNAGVPPKNAPKGEEWVNASGWGMWLNGKANKEYDENGKEKNKWFTEADTTKKIDRELCSFFYHAKDIVNSKVSYDLNGSCGNRPKRRYGLGEYGILRNALCPAVMSENLLQNNKKDVEYLRTEEGEKAILQIHLNAIVAFLKKYGYERQAYYAPIGGSSKSDLYNEPNPFYNNLVGDSYLNYPIKFDFKNENKKELYNLNFSNSSFNKTSKEIYKIIIPKGNESSLYNDIDTASPKELTFEKMPILSDNELEQIINNSAIDEQSDYWPKYQ